MDFKYYIEKIKNKLSNRRTIVIAVLIVIALIFEIRFLYMKYVISRAPGKLIEISDEQKEVESKSKKIDEQIEKLGGVALAQENKASWERLQKQIENAK